MSDVKMDLTLRAHLESATTLTFSDADDAEVFLHPWGDCPIVKTVQPIDDIEDPVSRLFKKAELGLLTKSTGLENSSWDAPLTKAETDPAALPARSQARLEKAFGVIERVFADHPRECEEAKSVARRLLLETRAEVAAAVAAAA